MADGPGVAVTLSSPVRDPVAPSPSDAAAEASGSSLVPPRSVTPPVGSSETDIAFGVSGEDVTKFWKTVQRQSVSLNYYTILPNILHGSIGSVATLEHFFEALVPGTYSVSAGQDDIGHCFVVVKTDPNARLVVLDGYSADHDPPMEVVPRYQWIESVKWISHVQL
ncbi:hypothetical protein PPTG_12827 [Phytophthora nicotianae INRA-310]|uniref:Uncharacterized protein n=1 Tax=Phytophthora nicotianae (strain INRA-310) TaxID=761204 RepID=W2Q1T1_PHYN3|nr:hypothetical protein PPTG_12827 [Phytophthora nicotianae INRA-310]ETN06806.1 hypothetical protein PPTG_12827 [Phytophthora nicotianae INRA-310]